MVLFTVAYYLLRQHAILDLFTNHDNIDYMTTLWCANAYS